MSLLLQKLGEIFWPRGLQCTCCGAFSGGELLCSACVRQLNALRYECDASADRNLRSAYIYDGLARELVLKLKEDCIAAVADILATGMAEVVREMNLPPETMVTWVTMTDFRKLKRWIDHGETLCRAVAAQTGLPVMELISRKGSVHTQRGLNRRARLTNLAGTMSCKRQINVPVLLIDDVMTTGATASICTAVLKEAGAPQVYVLTATRTIAK